MKTATCVIQLSFFPYPSLPVAPLLLDTTETQTHKQSSKYSVPHKKKITHFVISVPDSLGKPTASGYCKVFL